MRSHPLCFPPMPPPKKVVVIGAGPAGYVCAIRLAQLGQSVMVVEKEFLGGTCLNVGCIPSKALIAAGALFHRIGEASAMGITAENVKIDVQKLVTWKAGIVGKLTGGVGGLLKNHKVAVVMGAATFVDKKRLLVKTKEGDKTLEADTFGRDPHRGGLADPVEERAGRDQRLRRDAADVQAGAAEELLLDHGHLLAELREPDGAHVAGRTGADDDDLLLLSHGTNLRSCGDRAGRRA